jgi:hypothetical protein
MMMLMAGLLAGCDDGESGEAASEVGTAQTVSVELIETDCETAALGIDFPTVETTLWQIEICNGDGLCVGNSNQIRPEAVTYTEGSGILQIDCGSGWPAGDIVKVRYLAVN